MNATNPTPGSFLRNAWSWTLLPIVAWLIAIPFLGPGAWFVPIVIWNAPLGILGHFQKISLSPTHDQVAAIAVIHIAFWLLLFTGISLRRSLPVGWLGLIWLILAAALFMSISGCAAQLGPGLRNEGNWH